jgi:hypothetical protein
MTSRNQSNNVDHQTEETNSEQQAQSDQVRTTPEQSETAIRSPRSGGLRQSVQHCLLCQAETVGACLLCHRPLCEQCGASTDDFLRCPTHHQDEVEALRSTLRQAAESVMSTKQYMRDLVTLRNRVLHEVNVALLRSYVEQIGGVPSPAQIQQMRRVAVALWNSLAVVTEVEDTAILPGEDEGAPRTADRPW